MGDAAENEEDTEDVGVMTKVVAVTIRVKEGTTVVIEEAVEVITTTEEVIEEIEVMVVPMMTVEVTKENEAMVVTAMIAEAPVTIEDMVVTVITVVVTVKTIKEATVEDEAAIVIIGTETEEFKEVDGRNRLPIPQHYSLSLTN